MSCARDNLHDYEMLGSAADAEDVLQETWLRWSEVDLTEVRDVRAYLVRITTRLALNRIRTLARRRESYVGPWLPEPLLTAPDVEPADSVSTAVLVDVQREDRPEVLGGERLVGRVATLDDGGADEPSDGVFEPPPTSTSAVFPTPASPGTTSARLAPER